MKYDLFTKRRVRTVVSEKGVDYEGALHHFDTVRFAYVIDSDGNHYSTKEELENAKSVKSKSGSKSDSRDTSFGKVSKDPDRKLSGSDKDKSE